jgi:hypothetical protein
MQEMEKEPNPGFAGGIAKRSPIQRLAWALKGAEQLRKKDLRLNAMAAIAEGRKIRDRVTAMMRNAGAAPEDARVYCVFAEPDIFAEQSDDVAAILSGLDDESPIPGRARLRVQNGASDIKLATKFMDKLPIGFLIFVWDRNDWARDVPEKFVVWSIRPLIVEDMPRNHD